MGTFLRKKERKIFLCRVFIPFQRLLSLLRLQLGQVPHPDKAKGGKKIEKNVKGKSGLIFIGTCAFLSPARYSGTLFR
ncbi:hypothetical protein ASPBRDRAFT_36585 [Aspergillus brasiliensis CBS 101740]|uniref:Uncharacterized protein n=1 Tax=Aspergillus brasiliensis (strain CBS 101740 / IMI 381727 / IBT 21946) TaxID=767769 RepID=A0A1L9V0B4_ASPBC|nr:hypothetical protein ASPBRDRAFT_36585 [Aspergillus brasiliensis CBS 101740]